jgi:hypothetical protein
VQRMVSEVAAPPGFGPMVWPVGMAGLCFRVAPNELGIHVVRCNATAAPTEAAVVQVHRLTLIICHRTTSRFSLELAVAPLADCNVTRLCRLLFRPSPAGL